MPKRKAADRDVSDQPARQREIVLIAHNLRSTHNVGSLLRTADGLGLTGVFLTGYTPYPAAAQDSRLPHVRDKIHKQIHKTALGAESSINWQHSASLEPVLQSLRQNNFTIACLEQSPQSLWLSNYQAPQRLALIVGREVEGLEAEVLADADVILQIPMAGAKESFNVVQAAAMALYHLTYL